MFWDHFAHALLVHNAKALIRIERTLRALMAQDDDLTRAVTTLTTNVQNEIADVQTLLNQSANPSDPKIAAAIDALDSLSSSVATSDAAIKAAIANPAPAPATTVGATEPPTPA